MSFIVLEHLKKKNQVPTPAETIVESRQQNSKISGLVTPLPGPRQWDILGVLEDFPEIFRLWSLSLLEKRTLLIKYLKNKENNKQFKRLDIFLL